MSRYANKFSWFGIFWIVSSLCFTLILHFHLRFYWSSTNFVEKLFIQKCQAICEILWRTTNSLHLLIGQLANVHLFTNFRETLACIAYPYRNSFINKQDFYLYSMLMSFRTGTTKGLISWRNERRMQGRQDRVSFLQGDEITTYLALSF